MLNIANEIADIARDIARAEFRKIPDISLKTGNYPVTRTDYKIEQKIREYLQNIVPEHGIVGEEYTSKNPNSEYCWVIDPIDGTASFALGKPTFCTLISLLKDKKPIIGIIEQPILGERWCGIDGEKTIMNNIIYPAKCDNLIKFIRMSCTTPAMFNDKQRDVFQAVANKANIISYGGDGYSYGLLASGYIDLILEADLKIYDVMALIPIIQQVGGKITDWQGNKICIDTFDGTVLATCNAQLHREALSTIESVYSNLSTLSNRTL